MGLLFSFNGRITRERWWTGVLILIAVTLVMAFVTGAVPGEGLRQGLRIATGLFVLWCAAALSAKRLRDLGRPVLPRLLIFLAPVVLAVVMRIRGIGFGERVIDQATVNAPTAPGAMVVAALALAALVWAVAELGVGKSAQA